MVGPFLDFPLFLSTFSKTIFYNFFKSCHVGFLNLFVQRAISFAVPSCCDFRPDFINFVLIFVIYFFLLILAVMCSCFYQIIYLKSFYIFMWVFIAKTSLSVSFAVIPNVLICCSFIFIF